MYPSDAKQKAWAYRCNRPFKEISNDITFYHQNLQRPKAVLAHKALESDCSRRKAVPKATNKENNMFLPLKEKDDPS